MITVLLKPWGPWQVTDTRIGPFSTSYITRVSERVWQTDRPYIFIGGKLKPTSPALTYKTKARRRRRKSLTKRESEKGRERERERNERERERNRAISGWEVHSMEIAGASALRLACQSQPRLAFSVLPVCTYLSLNQNPHCSLFLTLFRVSVFVWFCWVSVCLDAGKSVRETKGKKSKRVK